MRFLIHPQVFIPGTSTTVPSFSLSALLDAYILSLILLTRRLHGQPMDLSLLINRFEPPTPNVGL